MLFLWSAELWGTNKQGQIVRDNLVFPLMESRLYFVDLIHVYFLKMSQ